MKKICSSNKLNRCRTADQNRILITYIRVHTLCCVAFPSSSSASPSAGTGAPGAAAATLIPRLCYASSAYLWPPPRLPPDEPVALNKQQRGAIGAAVSSRVEKEKVFLILFLLQHSSDAIIIPAAAGASAAAASTCLVGDAVAHSPFVAQLLHEKLLHSRT